MANSSSAAPPWNFRDSIIFIWRCFAETTRVPIMTDKAIELDGHRGMAAQKATELRRLLADVEANERALRERQDELEAHLIAAPAANWPEAAEKARYLLNLFAATVSAQDPRRQMLIAAVLADFQRLSTEL
jgi:hypothetical protein